MIKALWLAILLVFAGVTAGQAKTMSIAKDKVNVRAQPSKQARVIFTAPKGYPVVVKKRAPNWLLVEDWNGKRGWVYKKLVSGVPTTIIQADKAHVRKGPSRKKSSVAYARQGEIYKVLESRDGWVKIGYYFENEPAGWIHGDLVYGY